MPNNEQCYDVMPCHLLPRVSTFLLLSTFAVASLARGPHEFGQYLITVSADQSSVITGSDYQITVENEELLLTRLTAAFQGKLSNSFVADLDRDGAFEIVVTFSHSQGHATDLHVYTWNEYLLQPIRIVEFSGEQAEGYRGDDEIAVRAGKLIRMYPVYEEVEGVWTPTEQRRRFNYSFESTRWVAE